MFTNQMPHSCARILTHAGMCISDINAHEQLFSLCRLSDLGIDCRDFDTGM